MNNKNEAIEQKIEEIAIRMLKEGLEVNSVAQATGLSDTQIVILKNKL